VEGHIQGSKDGRDDEMVIFFGEANMEEKMRWSYFFGEANPG
jgi:hypothetical protein